MKSVSAGVRVAILFLLLVIGGYIVWKNLGQNPAGSDNQVLFAKFRDASGLPVGSKVVIAGLPKGEVTGLEVEGRYAKVTFRLSNDIPVWSSAVVIKKATSLLGENYLEIDPGEGARRRRQMRTFRPPAPERRRSDAVPAHPPCPGYGSDDPAKREACRQITNVVEATTPDELLHHIEETLPNVDRVLESVRDLSEDCGGVVNGPLHLGRDPGRRPRPARGRHRRRHHRARRSLDQRRSRRSRTTSATISKRRQPADQGDARRTSTRHRPTRRT